MKKTLALFCLFSLLVGPLALADNTALTSSSSEIATTAKTKIISGTKNGLNFLTSIYTKEKMEQLKKLQKEMDAKIKQIKKEYAAKIKALELKAKAEMAKLKLEAKKKTEDAKKKELEAKKKIDTKKKEVKKEIKNIRKEAKATTTPVK